MRFNVSSKAFASCVSAVSRIINAKNTLTVLNNFKLTLADNLLTVTASDGENFLEGRLTVADAEGEGSFCLDARRLAGLLKELPEVGLTVEVVPEDNYAVTIAYPNAEYNFMGFSGEEFPLATEIDDDNIVLSFTTEATKLLRGIDNTIFAVGNDELRPQMMGILWDIKADQLVFVATDTRKLVKFADRSIQAGVEGQFTMPIKSTVVFKNVFAKQERVTVTFDAKGVRFESAEFVFNSRFLKSNFPDYNRVIPKNNPFTLTIDRATFQSAVRRIGAFCDAANGLVRFRIEPDHLILKASESSFNAKAWESAPCDFTGEVMVIGFSAPYVSEILSTLSSREVLVHLADPSRPGVFVPAENEPDTELLMLLMPMLVAEF